MIRKKLFVFAVSFLWIGASAPPSAIQKKLEKLIHANFAVLNYDLKPVEVFTDIADQLPRSFNIDNFMSVDSEGNRIGFVYTGRGPSKTDVYDFAILFDSKLIIKSVKILQYREDYGGEIASKRWLKQFYWKRYFGRVRYWRKCRCNFRCNYFGPLNDHYGKPSSQCSKSAFK